MSTQNNANESRPYNYKNIKDNGKFDTGRPLKYRPEYCKQMIDFFSVPSTRQELEIITFKDGTTKESYKEVPNKLPHFNTFASSIGVHIDTINQWCKDYDDFSEAYKTCKELQKIFLIDNGLMGNYNPTFAIFTAKNITDMRDNVDQTVNINLNISDYLTQIPDKTSELIECPDYTVIDNKKAESDD